MVFFSSKIKQLKIFVNTFPIPGVSLLLLAAWKILAGTGGGDFCMRLLKFVSCWEAPLSENCLPLLTITFSFCAALWMFKDLTAFSLDACTLSKHFFLFYKSHLFQIRIIIFFFWSITWQRKTRQQRFLKGAETTYWKNGQAVRRRSCIVL